jgi:hypothetical protein
MVTSGIGFALIAYFTSIILSTPLSQTNDLVISFFNQWMFILAAFVITFLAGGIFSLTVDHNISYEFFRSELIKNNKCSICLHELSQSVDYPHCPNCDVSYHPWHLMDPFSNDRIICSICNKPLKEISSPLLENKLTHSIVIVDGNNIAFESKPPRLNNILIAEQELINCGYEPITIVSASLRYRIDEREKLETLLTDKKIIQAPSGKYDDRHILEAANKFNAFVLSNDRFRDLSENYPWIEERRIAFSFIRDELIIDPPENNLKRKKEK